MLVTDGHSEEWIKLVVIDVKIGVMYCKDRTYCRKSNFRPEKMQEERAANVQLWGGSVIFTA